MVDAKQSESKAEAERLDQADEVAVSGGTQPALLVHCGRINRIVFATPGLYNVDRTILDRRRLAVHRYSFPEHFSIYPAVPPLGVSPDERSFVRFGGDYDGQTNETHTALAVADFVGNRTYLVPVDEARMRYATLEAIDPAWLMHHFAWRKGSDGVDWLVERKGFVPLPYHSRRVEASGYWFEPARMALRDAIRELLVSDFKGEQVPVESYAYEYPVKIDGQVVNVAYGETAHYVSVSLARGSTDTKLLDTIVRHIDAALATGKYDAMFGR